LTVVVLLATACAPASPPSGLTRVSLLPGPPEYVRFENESRPAYLLGPGDRRETEVDLLEGSRLVFALAFGDQAPERGFVHLEVRANDRPVFQGRFSARRKNHWWHRSAVLPGTGHTRLSFSLRFGRPNGTPLPHPPSEAWIALAVPRIYPPDPPLAARRVLIWLSIDTVRAGHLGVYGYPRPTSPHFDQAASRLARFEHAVASASWTLPSMASQITSRQPSYHGAVLHDRARDDATPTLFDVLSRQGFTVLGVTGNDLISPAQGLADGFDALWFENARADRLARRLLAALPEWGGGDLALFVHYMDPHYPYTPPPPFDRRFDPDYEGTVHAGDTRIQALGEIHDPRDVAHVAALYDGEIAYTDREIHELLSALGERGLTDQAVIVYSADHGEELRDHGSWGHGGTLYQEVLAVPLAIRVPALGEAQVSQPVSMLDLAPTVLDAFGLEAPASFQGQSLLPLLRGVPRPEPWILSETVVRGDRSHLVSIRRGNLKYIVRLAAGRQSGPEVQGEEMYDLSKDPDEDHSDLGLPHLDELRRIALDYVTQARQHARGPRLAPLDEDGLARLRALGYIP
jgi:arylsulfatase A-like enzyme